MALIVLDSSVIIPHFRLDGPLLEGTLAAAVELGHLVGIPQVVFDELVGNYREALQDCERELRKPLEKLTRYLARSVEAQTVDADKEAQRYQTWLSDELLRRNVRLLPYPLADHRELVQRAMTGRKPFSSDGRKGYRDALIWETVLAAVRSPEEVVFATANVKDFSSPTAPTVLHEDLLRDIERDAATATIHLVTSLAALHQGFLAPRREMVDEISRRVQSGEIFGFSIETWLGDNLVDLATRVRGDFGLPRAYADVELAGITHVGAAKILSARYVGTSVFLLAEIEVEGRFHVQVDDIEGLLEADGIRPFLSRHFERYGGGTDYQTFLVTVALTAEPTAGRVTGAEVVEILPHGRVK